MTSPTRQTRFLFTAVPLQGHFWPCLCVAAALAKRGADVSFAAYEDKRSQVAAASPRIAFRALPPLSAELTAALGEALRVASNKIDVPPERRAPRVGSTVFPFYEEHMYLPLLSVAKEMVAAAAAAEEQAATPATTRVVIVCEHACLAAHDVAETLSLPLTLLWQLPLQYSLAMAGAIKLKSPLVRDGRVPVELPGAVLPASMSLWQRLVINPSLKKRQLRVLWDEYVPKRRLARERSGVAAQAEAAGGQARWKGEAPFAPAAEALPRPPLHIVSGSALLEPEALGRHALPAGWSLSGPQGVDLSSGEGDKQKPPAQHHPSVAALLAEAERSSEASIVYVAFGTLATFDDRATIEAMARAFVGLVEAAEGDNNKTFVIWSLPPAGQALLPADLIAPPSSSAEGATGGAKTNPKILLHVVPSADAPAPLTAAPQVLVVPRTEQQALLSHPSVKLFVSHCGLNSKCEALVRGVPLVGWPLFADQFINAQHAVNLGVGVTVPDDGIDGDGSHPTSSEGTRRDARAIEAIVRAALADGGMAARARELGERLRAAERSGADEAAETLAKAFGAA
jgi:hypothetical protein